MSNLRNEAATVKDKVNSASTALSNFESKTQKDIRDGLWNLHDALTSSSRAIHGILTKHRRRHLSLAILRTSSQEAAALSKSLDDTIGKLDVATQRASQSYNQCHSYYLQALDLPKYHIEPVRRSVQTLRSNIFSTQFQLETALKAATVQAHEAYDRSVELSKDIWQKELDIAFSQQKQRRNTEEIDQLRKDQDALERQNRDKERTAARLRGQAKYRRDKGKAIAVLTFGLGVLYTAYQYDRADDCDIDAGAAERSTRILSSRLKTAESKSTNLYGESIKLQNSLSALKSSKSRLDTDLQDQNQRVADLQTQIRNFNTQVTEAQAVLCEARELDKSIDPLSNQVRALQLQVLDLKQKLDGLKAAVEEKKDLAISWDRRKKGLILDKKIRNEMMSLLAETAGEIYAQIAQIENLE